MAEPEPDSVKPWYLRNLTQALALDESTGNVYLRTGITGDVVIEGNVNVPTSVEISNDVGNAIPVDGNINVDNFPTTQTVDGTISIQDGGNSITVDDGGSSITVDGNVEIANGVGNAIPVIGTDTNPYGIPVLTIDDDTVQHTSRNRRKVSDSEQIFFNTFQYTKDTPIWDEDTTGTASSTFSQFEGGVILEVGGTAGDEIIRQTHNVKRYIPGRANEAVFALRLNTPVAGVRKRIGIFDESNGAYFEDDGDEYYVVIRRNTSSGLNERRIPRSEWNGDRLDGNGPSGVEADPTKIQMMTIEYEWFGAGVVEFKFVLNNNAYPIHKFESGNIEDLPWSNTPFVPFRTELTNVDGVSGTHQMLQGSSALSAEGSVGPIGREENISTPLDGVTTDTANTFRPVLSIRLRPDRLNGVILPVEFQAATLDNTGLFYRVLRNSTLVDADFNNVGSESFAEFDYAATDFTDGEPIQTGFIASTNQGLLIQFPKESVLQLGRNDMGTTAQTFTILVATTQSNKDVFASLSWVEVR